MTFNNIKPKKINEKYDLLSFIYDKKFELVSKKLNINLSNSCEKCASSTSNFIFNYTESLPTQTTSQQNVTSESKLGFLINTSNFYKTKIGIVVSSNIILTSNSFSNENRPEDFLIFINDYYIYWVKHIHDSQSINFQYSLYLIETCLFNDVGISTFSTGSSICYIKPEEIRSKNIKLYSIRYIYSEKTFQFVTSTQIQASLQSSLKSQMVFTKEMKLVVLKEEENIFINNLISIYKSHKQTPFGGKFLKESNQYIISQSDFVSQCKSNTEEYLLENIFKARNTFNFTQLASRIDRLQNNDHSIVCLSTHSNCSFSKEDYGEYKDSCDTVFYTSFNMNNVQLPYALRSFNSQVDTLYNFKKTVFFTSFNTSTLFKREYLLFLIAKTNLIETVNLSHFPVKHIENEYKSIVNSIKDSFSIRKLEISGNFELFSKVTDVFLSNKSIFEVRFENCQVEDEDFSVFIDKINKNEGNRLSSLVFNSNFIGNSSFSYLLSSIISKANMFKSIKTLEFANNSISSLKNIDLLINLEVLNLYNNPISNEEADRISKLSSKKTCKLRKLNIGKCELTENFLIFFSKDIEDNRLLCFESLVLSSNRLNDYSVGLLSDVVFNKNHRLEYLDLSSSNLKNIEILINNIKLNESLRVINLNNNQIDDFSFNLLLTSSSLTYINKLFLANNHISSFNSEALSDFFKTNETLFDLDLSENLIFLEEILKFSSFLKFYLGETRLVDVNLSEQTVNRMENKEKVVRLFNFLVDSSFDAEKGEVSLVEILSFNAFNDLDLLEDKENRLIYDVLCVLSEIEKERNKNGVKVRVRF